jgi:protein LSM14
MLDVRKLEEFDFETANAEFEKLTKDVEDLKISTGGEGKKEGEAQETKEESESAETYNKTKSFFDSISCEALERQKGNVNRIDRRQERKLNQETFGVSGFYQRNWRGRGGGRGHMNNRGYNNNRSGNFNRNFNNGGQRQGGQGFGGRGGQNRRQDQGPRPRQEGTSTGSAW